MTVAHLAPWTTLLEALSSEVVRKLRLAGEADTKDDRDIICEEVFCDVTGLLDETAQVRQRGETAPPRQQAGTPWHQRERLPCGNAPLAPAQAQLGMPARVPFYVVLAQHYATPRGADSAVAVLHLLQASLRHPPETIPGGGPCSTRLKPSRVVCVAGRSMGACTCCLWLAGALRPGIRRAAHGAAAAPLAAAAQVRRAAAAHLAWVGGRCRALHRRSARGRARRAV